jgi:dihydropyrimidine dehydrogenase (NAD+) subunit PreA
MHTEQLREEDWAKAARGCLEGGVDALELNFSCPHLLAEWGVGSSIGEDPKIASMVTGWVRKIADVPIIVKLPSYVPDLMSVCQAVKKSGANAISTTNTVNCLNVDIEKKIVLPNVNGKSAYSGYSGTGIKPIGLRNVAKIAQIVDLPILGIGGISTWSDVIEYLMVGASAVQICTAVMLNGYRIVHELTDGVTNYMMKETFSTINDMVGFLLPQIVPYSNLSHESKVVSVINVNKCIKDDLCYIVCHDASNGAIQLNEERVPQVDQEKCKGCSLCQQVCPVTDCIEMRLVHQG